MATIAESGLRVAADVRLNTERAVPILCTRLRGVQESVSID